MEDNIWAIFIYMFIVKSSISMLEKSLNQFWKALKNIYYSIMLKYIF